MRALLLIGFGLVSVAAACSSDPIETELGALTEQVATATSTEATSGPTPLVIPTIDAGSGGNEPPTVTPTSISEADQAAPTVTSQPSATPRPIPTVAATAEPTPSSTPSPATPTPHPSSTATPSATPLPAAAWVNPDCYVGLGAADEPVWWCGAKICVVDSPHYGCPRTLPPYRPQANISCTISDIDIVVNEVITLTAVQDPWNIPVRYAFSHGDGTIDNTSLSRAFYRSPGSYEVTLLWQYHGAKGTTSCGTVVVHPGTSPTPSPTTEPVQIGCIISPRRTVQVNETLTFTAFQDPATVPVSFIFDHGDGTLDETSQSYAYYAAPGFYEVRLRWAHSG